MPSLTITEDNKNGSQGDCKPFGEKVLLCVLCLFWYVVVVVFF